MSLFVAKTVFFSLSGSKKLTGESVRGALYGAICGCHIRRIEQLTRSFPANVESVL